jgi:hypothetical protein
MLKLDEETTKAAIRKAIEELKIDGETEGERHYQELMRRTAAVQAEIAVAAMREIERVPDDPVGAIRAMAAVIAVAMLNAAMGTKDADNPSSTEPAHQMIHVFCDAVSDVMHQHFYSLTEAPPDKRHELVKEIAVSRRDVGDA